MKKKNIPAEELDFTDVFFKEVSEDVQNDNLKAFWKKYGVQIVAGVALCLTIAVSFETIKHWRDLQNQKWSDAFAYTQLLKNQSKEDDSIKALNVLADDGNAIYSDIARFEKINILINQCKTDEALPLLDDLTKNAHNEKLKNVALLKLASYKADTFSAEEMKQLVQPLFETVWEPEAKEFVALAHLRAGEKDKALAIYQEISTFYNVNDILRARAQNMISVLTSSGDKN
jgi:hypothetical protein